MNKSTNFIFAIIMMFMVGCSNEKKISSNLENDIDSQSGFRKSEHYAPCVMFRSGMSVVIVPLGFYDVMRLVSKKLVKDEGGRYIYYNHDLNSYIIMHEGSNGNQLVISYTMQSQSKLSYFECGPSIVYLGNAVLDGKFISQRELGKIVTEVLEDPEVERTNASHSAPENYEHRELRQFLELP